MFFFIQTIACREALALAKDLHIQKFVVASDAKQVIGDIHEVSQGNYGAIISEINLQASLLGCIFTLESRTINVEAHSLVKFALSLGLGRHA